MQWIVITAEDMNAYQVGAMMDALRTAALADGQTDPFAETMHDRCNYIRNRISGRTQISSTPYTIPPELKSQACLLILEAMQPRLPGLNLSEDHKTQIARAYKDLDIAATEDFPVSVPADAETPLVKGGKGSLTIVSQTTNHVTREAFSGL